MLLVQLDSVQFMKQLKEDIRKLWNATGPNGYSPLQLAAIGGHAPVVKFLSKFTENPNAPDPLGRTPLTVVTQKNHHEVVQVLLQALLEKYPSNPQAICNNLAI